MKILMHFFIFAYIVEFIFTQNGGLQIGIKQNLFDELKDKYLPDIYTKYKKFSIPDQFMDVGLFVTHLYLNLTDINFTISDFSKDNLHVNFSEPNKLLLNLKHVQLEGNFILNFSIFSILKEEDKINFTLNIKELNSVIILRTIESKIDNKKFLPSFEISNLDFDFDLDFDIRGKIFAQLARYFKEKIKSLIKKVLISEVKKLINEESRKLINGFIENQSVYLELIDDKNRKIAFDYSLTVNPEVFNGIIVLNLNGSFVDLDKKNYLDYNQVYSHDFEMEGKNVQILISEYSLNSGIRTLEHMNQLKFEISTDDFPKNSTLKLDTSILDLFFKDTSKKYGRDKKVIIVCESNGDNNSPGLKISQNNLQIGLEITCEILVQVINETQENYEEAMKFVTYLNFDAYVNLKEGGIINTTIKNLEVDKSRVISTKIPEADVEFVEEFVKFISPLVLPYLNKKYLNENHIKLPIEYGINIEDSNAYLEDKFLNLQVNPVIN